MTPAPMHWHFPLRRPHAGAPLGNGIQGVLVWGDDTLCLTVGRAGFWDRRAGQDIPASTTFADVRRALETEDDAGLAALFPKRQPGAVFPQQLGGGRLELSFPSGLRPIEATLELATARLSVRVGRDAGDPDPSSLHIRQAVDGEVVWITGDAPLLEALEIKLHPAFDLVRNNAMAALGIAPPETWETSDRGGFVQSLPADEPLAVAWSRAAGRIVLATSLGQDAQREVDRKIDQLDPGVAGEAADSFWAEYWDRVARVTVPDPVLQRQYDYGLYRQAGLIRRHAPAATLQGPWMEDTTIPPWSNDYHFNVNVQLVYGAAMATGQADEMQPLWDMLRSWLPRLRAMGEGFYGAPGAMILPHAVDDKCQLMGSFWAGTIDQACIAWMARLAYQSYAYSGDKEFLRELVWPLLAGAFEGYYAMLEGGEEAGAKRYRLPVSVSPEFGGSDRKTCWGRDASFQLAALHSTIRLLRVNAPVLGFAEDPRWDDVATHLPPYTLVDATDGSYGWMGLPAQRIALWEGQDLSESHRHHSHLGAIYPFCTIDPFDPAHQGVLARSINRWSTLGAGNWTGWCLPWASILCSRCGLVDSALTWLHLLAEQFTNEGHATLHNADTAGVFGWDDGSLAWPDHRKGADYHGYEVMQMDAAMGAISAILELLISVDGNTIRIADRLPKGWRELSFARVRVEGGFLISACFRHGRAEEVIVESVRGGELRIAPALGDAWTLDGTPRNEARLFLDCQSGALHRLRRISPV